jgi:glutamate racemase
MTKPQIPDPKSQIPNPISQSPIGVFDSGIGGLTVVRGLRSRLPGESIVYFGDTARLPYGTKSAETITRFAVEDAEFLVSRGVKLVIAACHSASSVALPELSRCLSVPVLGVIEPGARALVAATHSGRVAVIGTGATIRAGAYEQAIRKLCSDVEIVAKATPLFVPLAEEGWLDNDVAEATARRYLSRLVDERVDALLLGCTHYPLLAPLIGRVLGPGVRLVDSSEETAVAAEEMLKADASSKSGLATSDLALSTSAVRGSLTCYLSDLSPNFEVIGGRFLGEPLGEVLRASVGKG